MAGHAVKLSFEQTHTLCRVLRIGQWTLAAVLGPVALYTLVRVVPPPKVESAADAALPEVREVGRVAAVDASLVWSRSLRDDLRPPKPPPPPPVVKERAAPQLPRLIATFVEADGAWGLFAERGGTTAVKGIGDRIDDAEIVGLSDGSARVVVGGETYVLQVPKPEGTLAGKGMFGKVGRR